MLSLQIELVDRLVEKMEARGLTQADLARISKLSTKHVNQMINGRIEGSLAAWQALFDACEGREAAGPKVCVLCGRVGVSRFIYEAGEYRCSAWGPCQDRQRRLGFRPI